MLLQAGASPDLLDRIHRWARRSPKILGVGIDSGLGEELPDTPYLRAWKELRDETRAILAELRTHLPAKADVTEDVFDTLPPEQWTDEAILAWRHRKIRTWLVFRYGILIGVAAGRDGGACPDAFDRKEERDSFEDGVRFAAAFRDYRLTASPEELEDLRKRLGRA